MTSNTKPPFIIPVFLPNAGCPHQCVFCNQSAVTGLRPKLPTAAKIESIIQRYLSFPRAHRGETQIAFYGGNFLGLDTDSVRLYLQTAGRFVQTGCANSLRFSTRPDSINAPSLEILEEFPVKIIEVGAQSMDDAILARSRRGHAAFDTLRAVKHLKAANYKIGLQMMVGLPGDTGSQTDASARQIAALEPDFVRIYPTVVLKNSPLAKWYRKGRYKPMSINDSVAIVKKIYLFFQTQGIAVVRMGLQISQDLGEGSQILAGPYHPAFGHLVYSEIYKDAISKQLASRKPPLGVVTLKVHPRHIPRVRGLKNQNLRFFQDRFQIQNPRVVPDPSLETNQVVVEV